MAQSLCQQIETLDLNNFNAFNMTRFAESLPFEVEQLIVHQDESIVPNWDSSELLNQTEPWKIYDVQVTPEQPPSYQQAGFPWERHETAKVLIFGHSYVRRLHHYLIRNRGHFNNLGLDYALAQVEWYARGGLRADQAFFQYMEVIHDLKPHLLYLQLGSNDLCNVGATPRRVSDFLYNIANVALNVGVQRVVIGETFRRKRQGIPRSTPNYNQRVEELNAINHARFSRHPHISVWKHRGFQSPRAEIMCRDGVHFNRKGQAKYYRSVRGSILVNLRKLGFSAVPTCRMFSF